MPRPLLPLRRKGAKTPRKLAAVPCPPTALAPELLTAWAVRGLRVLKVSPADARTIADALVQTSLWGTDSHGIARLGHYFSRLRLGSIAARPRIRVRRTGPSSAQVDGGHGHGIVVCRRAMDEAIALARRSGVGVVGVSNSSHCGAIGLYGRQAAAAGLISIGFTHSDAFVAPYGGRRKFLGTNPICITIPTRDRDHPLCLDMATSAVPYNKVVNARREKRPLQAGWALDRRGRPTLDAEAAACLLPLAGYKGYGLALMIDLLCGPLNGMPFGPHIPDMYVHLTKRRKLGSFFVVIDPRRFAGGSRLPLRAARMAREARAQPRLAGSREILAPGDPEYRSARRRAAGIPIEAGLWRELSSWSQRLGIAEPGA
jgi:ureidoglycolate dehydrogenase (NAD+)